MKNSEEKPPAIETVRDNLFNFAVDREDIKWLMERFPEEANISAIRLNTNFRYLRLSASVGAYRIIWKTIRSRTRSLSFSGWRFTNSHSVCPQQPA
jgi:hypothetical protein